VPPEIPRPEGGGAIHRSAKKVAVFAAATLIAVAPSSPAQAACGWRSVPVPSSGIFSVLLGVDARTTADAWAVGESVFRGKVSGKLMARPFTLHWNGTSWKVIKAAHLAGTKNEVLQGVAMVSKDDVWAVGGYESATSGAPGGSEIQHWDGVKWSIVPTPPLWGWSRKPAP
jgi:hypothetical protein